MTYDDPTLERVMRLPEVGDQRDGMPVMAVDRERCVFWIAPSLDSPQAEWRERVQE